MSIMSYDFQNMCLHMFGSNQPNINFLGFSNSIFAILSKKCPCGPVVATRGCYAPVATTWSIFLMLLMEDNLFQ